MLIANPEKVNLTAYKRETGVHVTRKMTGKMQSIGENTIASLSTSPNNPICAERAKNRKSICFHCFSQAATKRYNNLDKCLTKNGEILTAGILETVPEIKTKYFRFESHGDLQNATQVINYFNICYANPAVKFALWTKNPKFIEKAISAGYDKPVNLQIVCSSPYMNKVKETPYSFVDKVFTVYDAEHIDDVGQNCPKRCMDCCKCYDGTGGRYINEKLK